MENKASETFIENMRFLGKYLFQNIRGFSAFFIGWYVEGLLCFLLPILLGILADEMIYHQNVVDFLKVAGVVLGMSIFWSTLYFFVYMFFNFNYGKYAFSIKKDLFDKLGRMSVSAFSKMKNGDIINTIVNYSDQCIFIINRNIIYAIRAISLIGLYVWYIFSINRGIGIWIVSLVIVSSVISICTTAKIGEYSNNEKEVDGKYQGWLFDTMGGITDIKCLSSEAQILKKYIFFQEEMLKLSNKKKAYAFHMKTIAEGSNFFIEMILFIIAAMAAAQNTITLGTFLVLYAFYKEIKVCILLMNGYFSDWFDRLAYVNKIKNFLELEEELNECCEVCIEEYDVRYEKVSFSYGETEPVLNQFSFELPKGKVTALVGESGSGKTTIVNLLLRFFETTEGNIFIGRKSIREIPLGELRHKIGIMQQKSYLFEGTIWYNLVIGNPDVSEEDVVEACRIAGIYEEILQKKDGFETIVGRNGEGLSGGQKQRLAFARLLLRKPSIIIFDEPTSALDMENEAVILDALEKMSGKTIIVISHRLSTIEKCDYVLTIKAGKVQDFGPRDQQLKQNEFLRKLFVMRKEENQ